MTRGQSGQRRGHRPRKCSWTLVALATCVLAALGTPHGAKAAIDALDNFQDLVTADEAPQYARDWGNASVWLPDDGARRAATLLRQFSAATTVKEQAWGELMLGSTLLLPWGSVTQHVLDALGGSALLRTGRLGVGIEPTGARIGESWLSPRASEVAAIPPVLRRAHRPPRSPHSLVLPPLLHNARKLLVSMYGRDALPVNDKPDGHWMSDVMLAYGVRSALSGTSNVRALALRVGAGWSAYYETIQAVKIALTATLCGVESLLLGSLEPTALIGTAPKGRAKRAPAGEELVSELIRLPPGSIDSIRELVLELPESDGVAAWLLVRPLLQRLPNLRKLTVACFSCAETPSAFLDHTLHNAFDKGLEVHVQSAQGPMVKIHPRAWTINHRPLARVTAALCGLPASFRSNIVDPSAYLKSFGVLVDKHIGELVLVLPEPAAGALGPSGLPVEHPLTFDGDQFESPQGPLRPRVREVGLAELSGFVRGLLLRARELRAWTLFGPAALLEIPTLTLPSTLRRLTLRPLLATPNNLRRVTQLVAQSRLELLSLVIEHPIANRFYSWSDYDPLLQVLQSSPTLRRIRIVMRIQFGGSLAAQVPDDAPDGLVPAERLLRRRLLDRIIPFGSGVQLLFADSPTIPMTTRLSLFERGC